MQRFDNIIIGGGHNGLICATYLANAGQTVLLVEGGELGGLASTREFHPGFKVSVAHSLSHFSEDVSKQLSLAQHGFKPSDVSLTTVGLSLDGKHVVVTDNGVEGVGESDQDSYTEYLKMLNRFAKVLKPFWLKTMPRIGDNSLPNMMTFGQLGLKLRLLGKKDMGEFMRVATLPARDLMDENFDNELLKAVLSWDGLIGSKMAPRSPNATVLNMLYRMSGGKDGAHTLPQGGISNLIDALHKSALASGVEIKTGVAVSKIVIEKDSHGQRASGIVLQDGTVIKSSRVVSSVDPKQTFLELVGARNLEIGFTNRINRLRSDGYVAKLHLALDGLPSFTGLDTCDGRMIIAPTMDSIEFAFDDAKYGDFSQSPVMEIILPSIHDSAMAPSGQHVLSAHVMYVPHALKGGWTEQAKDTLYQRLIDLLSKYAPGIEQQIIHGELLTPDDLEKSYRLNGGHWHHTELSMDQMLMMRPTYEAAQYSTPIPGLFLCGAGSHPGGGLMGGPGHNAAKEILRSVK